MRASLLRFPRGEHRSSGRRLREPYRKGRPAEAGTECGVCAKPILQDLKVFLSLRRLAVSNRKASTIENRNKINRLQTSALKQ
jgi:hypothetical protein